MTTDDWFSSLFASLPGMLVGLLPLTLGAVLRASSALDDGEVEEQDQRGQALLVLPCFSPGHVVGSSPSCLSLSLFSTLTMTPSLFWGTTNLSPSSVKLTPFPFLVLKSPSVMQTNLFPSSEIPHFRPCFSRPFLSSSRQSQIWLRTCGFHIPRTRPCPPPLQEPPGC